MADRAHVKTIPAETIWRKVDRSSWTISNTSPTGERPDSGYYIRKFALDDTINGNDWGVTGPSIWKYMDTFVQCPVVLIPGSLDHPAPVMSEAFRVGEVINTRVVKRGDRIIGEDTIYLEEHAAQLVYSGALKYTSVQIMYYDGDYKIINEGTPFEHKLIHKWYGSHDAIVGEPAYGRDKAVMRHICKGTESECKRRLPSPSQADLSDPTVAQVTIVPFVARSLGRMYQPCTLKAVLEQAHANSPLGRLREQYPDLLPEQAVAMAIAPDVESESGVYNAISKAVTAMAGDEYGGAVLSLRRTAK